MTKKRFKQVHFIGIKGVGMTPLAIIAKEMGAAVTGSDIKDEFPTDLVLKRFGISWKIGFRPENIEGRPDLVVVTGAHGGMTNPEALAAKLSGLRVVMQGEALGMFMEGYKGISVAGCHGKTTTTAFIAHLLIKSGVDPSFAIGCGDIPSLSGPGHLGKGEYFIAEADEYMTCPLTNKRPKFFWQNPNLAVFTNIEYDHPDLFPDIEAVKKAFLKFSSQIKKEGVLVACLDNQNIRAILPKIERKIQTYGLGKEAAWQLTKVRTTEKGTKFEVEHKGLDLGEFSLSIPGVHNALNALAALIVGVEAGKDLETLRLLLPSFSGTKRHFEFIGEAGGVKLYDDYAHHPTEISSTLAAARTFFGKAKIICIFQPHTYSRTKVLFEAFAHSFSQADEVILVDIYSSARETDTQGINSQILGNKIAGYHKNAKYLKNMEEVVEYLGKKACPGDIIFTMGAGDLFRYHQKLLEKLGAD